MSAVLSTDGLVKRFGGLTATNNVTFSLPAGARHALSLRPGMGHSFLGFARMVDEAGRALQDAAEFINAAWAEAHAANRKVSV